VADKRGVRRSIHQLQRVKTWQLVLLLILAGFLAATFLRLNNIGMIERRSAVLAADEAGNSDATIDRLYDLQRYVSSHMNTDMGKGVYLESSYKRDVQAVYDAASSQANDNGNIYKKAQEICAPQFSRWSSAYVLCTSSELAKFPAGADLVSAVKLPKADAYLHVYSSPLWSPDFAGWTLLICALIGVMIITRISSLALLRSILHRHYKSV